MSSYKKDVGAVEGGGQEKRESRTDMDRDQEEEKKKYTEMLASVSSQGQD